MVCLDSDVSDPFEIVVGTYEHYLVGYKVDNIVNTYKMERTFATHSHLASVRSLDAKKHYLASGGADDSVCLYDMNQRIECGKLVHHNDTVNCVTFTPEASHMFTCSNDGSIAAIRCGNWQIEKHWKAPHKGLAVNAIAVHPTGKIALSAGADGILRTWNLVKGRQAYATNLTPRMKLDARNVTVLKWSPNGEKYLLAVNQRIDIYSVEVAGIDREIKLDTKIVCVEFLRDDLLAVGLENGQVRFYDLEKSKQTVEVVAHDIRVKCISFVGDLLVTASSSGEIKLWRYSKNSLDMLQSVNCGARITCLTLALNCNNVDHEIEVKLEEEEKEVKKKTFRLRQEVVIEKEGDWDVTSINQRRSVNKKKRKHTKVDDQDSSDKKRKKLLKKKRKNENTEEADNQKDNGIPKKKKRVMNQHVEEEKKENKKRVMNQHVEEEKREKKKRVMNQNVEEEKKENKKRVMNQHVEEEKREKKKRVMNQHVEEEKREKKKKRQGSINSIEEMRSSPSVKRAKKAKGFKEESILEVNNRKENRLKKKSPRLGKSNDLILEKRKKKN